MTEQKIQSNIAENKIPEGWVETSLGEMMDISSGKSRPKNKGKYPVYGGNGILDHADDFNFENETIIIGRVGAYCGCVYFEKNKFWLSDNALGIKENKKSDIKFLYYLLINLNLNKNAIGGAQPLLTQGILNQIEIKIPPILEQQAIASVLSAFDDKIELLREENKTLEEIGQTVFGEWFGKYSVERPEELPEGWRVGKIVDVVNIFDSRRIPLSSNQRLEKQGKYPYHGATSIMDYVDEYLFDGIYLLLAEDGSVMDQNGYPVLQYVWNQFWVNNHAHVLQGSNGFSTEILYLLFRNTKITGIVNGAVQLKINQTNLMNFEIIIPDLEILKQFNDAIQSIFGKIRDNSEHIQSLARSRDEILPRLMNGEVRASGH